MQDKIIRKNIRMGIEIAEWYEKKAKKLGVSQSSVMVMALSEYMKQEETVSWMGNLEEFMKSLKNEVASP